MLGWKRQEKGLCAHAFHLMSSPGVLYSLLPVVISFLDLTSSRSSLFCGFLPTVFFRKAEGRSQSWDSSLRTSNAWSSWQLKRWGPGLIGETCASRVLRELGLEAEKTFWNLSTSSQLGQTFALCSHTDSSANRVSELCLHPVLGPDVWDWLPRHRSCFWWGLLCSFQHCCVCGNIDVAISYVEPVCGQIFPPTACLRGCLSHPVL